MKNSIRIVQPHTIEISTGQPLRSVLSHCIGVFLYDTSTGLGGVAACVIPGHILLSSGKPVELKESANALLEELFGKMKGGKAVRKNTKAIVIGATDYRNTPLEEILESVRSRLKKAGIPILYEDLGGHQVLRRATLYPKTATLKIVRNSAADGCHEEMEKSFLKLSATVKK